MTYSDLYNDFLAGDDTLRVYRDTTLVFSSQKDRLHLLFESTPRIGPIFDNFSNAVNHLTWPDHAPLVHKKAVRCPSQFAIDTSIKGAILI